MVQPSGVWKHFDINLGGVTFQDTNGFNQLFNPTAKLGRLSSK